MKGVGENVFITLFPFFYNFNFLFVSSFLFYFLCVCNVACLKRNCYDVYDTLKFYSRCFGKVLVYNIFTFHLKEVVSYRKEQPET